MRNRPHRLPRAPKLDWPGGVVPEWAKPQAGAAARRGGAKGGRGRKDNGKRERLQKVMAQSGHGSRRNLEILIAQGHVTINGQVAKLGDLVGPGDRVKLDGKLISLRFGAQLPRVLLYHKPEGEICTRDDPEGRPTVFAKLPKVNNARWVSIGRLDFNTSGLLIFTTNGELANRLMHPRYEIEREYAVRLMGSLTPEQVQRLTGEGVDIDGETCRFVRLVDKGGEGANHWYHVVLKEGKNREVRRLFEAVGLMVSRLMRVRYGPVELPSFLKRGMMRDMAEADVAKLVEFAGMNEPAGEREGADEDEDDYAPGNVAPPGELAAAPEEWDEDEDDDELQPAHLLDDWKPAQPVVDDDDDRQPDFDRLPGFNRATGTMGLPAGHRGHHPSRGPGQGPAQGAGQGPKKRRGKRRGAKAGSPGNVAAPFAPRGEGMPSGQGPAPRTGRGKKRRAKGAAPVPGQGGAQPSAGPPDGQGAQGQAPAAGGKGKSGRNRRNRSRGRNRGRGGEAHSSGEGKGGDGQG